MSDQKLLHRRVAILATHGFEEAELFEPRRALDKAGAQTVVIAPAAGRLQALKHDEKGERVDVDLTLDQADPDGFDALVLPGGVINADALRVEPKAQAFVRRMDESKKPIAVICHGPWLLVSAGLVKGRTLTSYHTIQDDIRNAGGKWVDEKVVADGNWVSSREPSDIPAFNSTILELFAQPKQKAQQAS